MAHLSYLQSSNRIVPVDQATGSIIESVSSDDDDDSDDDSSDESSDDSEISDGNGCKESCFRLVRQIEETVRTELSIEKLKGCVKWFLDVASFEFRISFDDVSFGLTLYVLFVPSIVYLAVPKSADFIFTAIMTFCFSFFVFELVATTWSKTTFKSWQKQLNLNIYIGYIDVILPVFSWDGYFFSYLWFLDVIVIISMFPDIAAIADGLGLKNFGAVHTETGLIVRMLRLFRIIKVYNINRDARFYTAERLHILDRASRGEIDLDEELKQLDNKTKRPSKLGAKLSEFTSTRVIILILVFLVVIPFLIYRPLNQVFSYSTGMIQALNTSPLVSQDIKDTCIGLIISELDVFKTPLLYLEAFPFKNGTIVNNQKEINALRDYAIISQFESSFNVTTLINYYTSAEFSVNYFIRMQAIYTMIVIVFAGVIAYVASRIFTRDTENLVLKPIERMMKMVETVALNPLARVRFDNEPGFGTFETNLLEKTFVKIAGLLRVCFGEAGAGIIKSNLKLDSKNPSSAIINGIRVYCIIGFCGIHQFDFVVKRLGKDVLTFVNTIAAVVHERVHAWEGSCNKNLGNAFVIIWRIGEESSLAKYTVLDGRGSTCENSSVVIKDPEKMIDRRKSSKFVFISERKPSLIIKPTDSDMAILNEKQKYQQVDLRRLPGVDKLAAKSLIGFLKIISDLNRNENIYKYHGDSRLDDDGTSFKVRMGFGLHAGWAIEGAVGSLQKVDATYLSPHVNMAARLETASRQYGVALLISQSFYDLLSPYIQKFIRRIDVVTVKGSQMALGIYTYDTLEQLRKPAVGRRNSTIDLSKLIYPNSTNPVLNPSASEKKRASLSVSTQGLINGNDSKGEHGKSVSGKRTARRPSSEVPTSTSTSTGRRVVQSEKAPGGNDGTNSAASGGSDNNNNRRASVRKRSEYYSRPLLTAMHEPEHVFDNDRDVVHLRSHIETDFLVEFTKGVDKYTMGDWTGAKEHLEKSDLIMRMNTVAKDSNNKGDGPSQTLLKYMASLNNVVPPLWKGFRPLTSK